MGALASLARMYCALAALPLLGLATAAVFYITAFDGRIYPHVVAGGVEVGGLSLAEARARLREAASELLVRPLAFSAGGRQVSLAALGVALPPSAIDRVAGQAHAVGRGAPHDPSAFVRDQLLLWRHGEQLAVPLELDPSRARAALDDLATHVERPAANAHIELIPTENGYEVHTMPAVVGEQLDRDATLARLRAWLVGGTALAARPADLIVEVVIVSIPPSITDADVAALRDQIDAIAGAPLVFRRGDGEAWSIDPAALATVLRLEGLDPVAYYNRPAGAPRPALVIDEAQLAALVQAIADAADRPAQEPALEVRGEQVHVRAGRAGHLVDRAHALQTARDLLAAAGAGGTERTVSLRTAERLPVGEPAALEPVAEWLNERLALPLLLEHQGSRRVITRADLVRLLELRVDAAPGPTTSAGAPGLDRAAVRAFLAAAVPAWVRIESGQDVVEPSLALSGDLVEIVQGRAGQTLDVDAMAGELAIRFSFSDPAERVAPVLTALTPPRLSTNDLLPARDAAQRLIDAPVRIYSPAGDWLVPAELLSTALRFDRLAAGGPPIARLDRARVATALGTLGREAEVKAAALGLRDATGGPLVFDALATADEVIDAAALSEAERYAPLRWRGD